jgi:hypothetical protein
MGGECTRVLGTNISAITIPVIDIEDGKPWPEPLTSKGSSCSKVEVGWDRVSMVSVST